MGRSAIGFNEKEQVDEKQQKGMRSKKKEGE